MLANLESSLGSAYDLCEMNNGNINFDTEMLTKLSAVTSCLPSLKLMLESVDASERSKSIVILLQAIQSKLGSKETTTAIVTWSPALVTTPSNINLIDQRMLTSGFSLPAATISTAYSGEGATKKMYSRAKKQKQTFAEFLKGETERPAEAVQSYDYRVVHSVHGPVQYDEIKDFSTEDIPIIDVLRESEYPTISRDAEKISHSLNEDRNTVVDSIVVETTAVEDITSDEKAFKLVVTGLDVALFLVEALLKSAFPVLLDGGRQAVKRILQTLAGPKVRIPLSQWIASRKRGRDTIAETDWELLEGFENVKIV